MSSVSHPGERLRDGFMAPLGPTVADVARLACVSPQRIYERIAGKRGVTVDTAVRLGRVFRMKPQHWLAMQAVFGLQQAEVPEGVTPPDLKGYVTGPRGVLPLPPSRPREPVDMRFSSERLFVDSTITTTSDSSLQPARSTLRRCSIGCCF